MAWIKAGPSSTVHTEQSAKSTHQELKPQALKKSWDLKGGKKEKSGIFCLAMPSELWKAALGISHICCIWVKGILTRDPEGLVRELHNKPDFNAELHRVTLCAGVCSQPMLAQSFSFKNEWFQSSGISRRRNSRQHPLLVPNSGACPRVQLGSHHPHTGLWSRNSAGRKGGEQTPFATAEMIL